MRKLFTNSKIDWLGLRTTWERSKRSLWNRTGAALKPSPEVTATEKPWKRLPAKAERCVKQIARPPAPPRSRKAEMVMNANPLRHLEDRVALLEEEIQQLKSQ